MRFLIFVLVVLLSGCASVKKTTPVPKPAQVLSPKAEVATKDVVPGKRSKRRGARPASMVSYKTVVFCSEKDRLTTRSIRGSDGKADKLEACMKRADGSFVWVVITAP